MFHWRTHFSFNTDGTTKHVRLPILDHNTEEAVVEERYPSGEISLTNDLEKDLFARSLISLPANMITKDATPSHTHLAKISSALVTTNGKDHDLPSGVGASTLPKHVHLLTVDRNSEGTVAQQLNDTAPLSDAAATDIQTQGQSTTTFSYDLEHNKPRFFGVSMPMPTPAPLGDGLSIDDHKATYFRNSSGNADLLPPTALTKENPNENLSNDLFKDHSRPKAESVWSGIESSSDSRGSELPRTLIYKAMDDRIFKASSHVKNSSETIISFRQKKVVFKNALTRSFILKASPMLERPPEFELPHGCDGLHSNDLFVCVDASYLCFGENGIPSSCIASSNISSFSLLSSGTLSSGTVSSSIVSSTPESGRVLSTIRDLEDSEKKLTSIVDRASHAMQILAAESELPEAYAAKENLILSVAIQTEVIRALEMQLALPERLLHPDIIDLKWLTEVVQDTNDDDTCKDAKLETLRRLQTASAGTLSHLFEWLADVM
ncbi:hypothetical protein F5879DRAFT_993679 [Lentinula edodes]|nr:hypothetical protein F5879DRAFT_993679 [Lentinula edodes]